MKSEEIDACLKLAKDFKVGECATSYEAQSCMSHFMSHLLELQKNSKKK